MLETELAIVGSGPAGLGAAVEAGKRGVNCTLVDENLRAGGQLFKQIHKFFGSEKHFAGTRGFEIGQILLEQAEKYSKIILNTPVIGLFEGNTLALKKRDHVIQVKSKKIIFATGASERVIKFPGWTLPGVMGAGAVQTMVNVHRVLPGERFLIVGAGNVGLIVGYQLLQAGAKVKAIVEATPKIGGYYVHANKIRRLGLPIFTSHTVKAVRGSDHVEEAAIAALNKEWEEIPGTEKTIPVDVICLAVGLKPRIDLPLMAGCETLYFRELGGDVPIHNNNMETTQPGIYVIGDVSGIEEASTALEEGRLA